jgi:hypothetical protein
MCCWYAVAELGDWLFFPLFIVLLLFFPLCIWFFSFVYFVLLLCVFCFFSYYLVLFDLVSRFLYKNSVAIGTFVRNTSFNLTISSCDYAQSIILRYAVFFSDDQLCLLRLTFLYAINFRI